MLRNSLKYVNSMKTRGELGFPLPDPTNYSLKDSFFCHYPTIKDIWTANCKFFVTKIIITVVVIIIIRIIIKYNNTFSLVFTITVLHQRSFSAF